ncbi:MAG: Inward rectifier potassium channel Irk [Deinococcales bacterium]|nr:Inward rectifier potassium channel Irk [Chitinophagaceae bacterium]
MALLKNFNLKAKAETETGLGTNVNYNGGRFFNKDGSANIEMRGMSFFSRFNVYHSLLSITTWKFLAIIFIAFFGINLLFAALYLVIGINHLGGMVANSNSEKFGEAFFFSTQTFTTVGYGRINPIGFAASFTAAVEALIGLMSFALITGLLYGRFARPRAYIRYSENALFTPFRGGTAFMFRIVPYTKNFLVNVEAKVTLSMQIVDDDGIKKNKFFNLPLDIAKASSLISNWTIVHVIDEESPFYNLSKQDIDNANIEILILVQGFDESFANTVIARGSYIANEFVHGAKFLPMYHPNEDNTSTILELDKLNAYEEMKIVSE